MIAGWLQRMDGLACCLPPAESARPRLSCHFLTSAVTDVRYWERRLEIEQVGSEKTSVTEMVIDIGVCGRTITAAMPRRRGIPIMNFCSCAFLFSKAV